MQEGEEEMKQVVGKVDDFVQGRCRAVRIGGRDYLIWRSGDQFYATRDACPHQGAPLEYAQLSGTMLPAEPKRLEYGMCDQVIRCPWHKWEFDVRTGEALFGTERRRLVTYPVSVEGDQVYLEVKSVQ